MTQIQEIYKQRSWLEHLKDHSNHHYWLFCLHSNHVIPPQIPYRLEFLVWLPWAHFEIACLKLQIRACWTNLHEKTLINWHLQSESRKVTLEDMCLVNAQLLLANFKNHQSFLWKNQCHWVLNLESTVLTLLNTKDLLEWVH